MSRGFVCALFGIAMTIFAWFSPWLWPAFPSIGGMNLMLPVRLPFDELPYNQRAAIVLLLIAVNVAVWAGLLAAVLSIFRARVSRLKIVSTKKETAGSISAFCLLLSARKCAEARADEWRSATRGRRCSPTANGEPR